MVERLSNPEYAARVRSILDQLEKLEPNLTHTRRDQWLARFRNVMAFVSLIAFVVAGYAVQKSNSVNSDSITRSQRQAEASKRQAACINHALAERNVTTDRDTASRRKLALAQQSFARGNLNAVRLILQNHPLEGLTVLNTTDSQFSTATREFVAEQDSIKAYRDQHPLGEC